MKMTSTKRWLTLFSGVSYCENPVAEEYETLGIFVPGDYMNAVDNGDGTFTCEMNAQATVGNYTAETAPLVIPVDTLCQ